MEHESVKQQITKKKKEKKERKKKGRKKLPSFSKIQSGNLIVTM